MTEAEVARRRAMLALPHMRALAEYARRLNARGLGWVPDFDPLDGGVQARLLLVLEKPGPGMQPPAGTGFVSRDNTTPTALAIRTGMIKAGIPREGTAVWNVVPWWNGTMATRIAEKREGAAELGELCRLMPGLRCVVLSGNAARAFAAPQLTGGALRLFECVHPSPQSRAGPASSAAWHLLPGIWKHAWAAAS